MLKIGILPQSGIFETAIINNSVIITGGFESQLLQMLLQGLNMPYEVLLPKDPEWGHKTSNGNWTGLMGMIARDEIDMAVGYFFLSEDRLEISDYSYPYSSIEMTFATRLPEIIHSSLTFIHPFTIILWISLFLAVLIVSIVLRCLLTKSPTLSTVVFNIFGSLLESQINIKLPLRSDKILLMTWLFAAFFISHSYSSVLLSFLTVPLREKSIKTFQSLSSAVQNNEMKGFLLEGSVLHKTMAKHADNSIRELAEAINENSWFLKVEPKTIKKSIFGDRNALIGTRVHVQLFLDENVFISNDILYTLSAIIVLNKKFKYKERINKIIHRIIASGIYNKNVENFLFYKRNKFPSDSYDPEKKISLEVLKGAFIVLFIGYMLAACTCIIEVLYFRIFRN